MKLDPGVIRDEINKNKPKLCKGAQHLNCLDYIYLEKKPDMKFIILVSNLKEISPSVFSWKYMYIKNYDAILLSKYDSAEKKVKVDFSTILSYGVDSVFFLLGFLLLF
jgi:hypothetical protein